MGYVPGFQYDIFLSYASDDLDDKLRALFADLGLALRRELGKEFSKEHDIFLDKDELNHSPIAWKEKLRRSADSAAILVPILSPAYATSDYCAKEFEWFGEKPPLDWPAGDQSVYRICPVSWRPINKDLVDQLASDYPPGSGEQNPVRRRSRAEAGQRSAHDEEITRHSLLR